MSLQDQNPVTPDDVSEDVVSKSLDYKIVSSTTPKYRYSLLVPQQGQTAPINPGATSTSMIELPAGRVFNLGESSLNFTVQVGRTGVANSANWMYTDKASMINRIQLYTRSGQYIVDIPYTSKYLEVVQKVSQPTDRFIGRSQTDFFAPNNAPAFLDSFRPGTSVNAQAAGAPSAKVAVEPRYVISSGVATVANTNDVPVVSFQLRLGDIPECGFVDKDLIFNEVLILSIEWARGSDYLWYTTGADMNAANNNPAGLIASVAYANANPLQGFISNINFFLAVETDPDIAQMVRNMMYEKGLEVLISFPYVFYNQIAQSQSQAISLRFNNGNGLALSKVYSAPFNNDQTRHLAFDHSNINASKVLSYYTMIDNSRLQEFNVTCSDAVPLDYMQTKPILRNTPISDINVFRYNWFICDDFSKEGEVGNDPNAVGGLELTGTERKWDLLASTTNNAYNWYTFAITKRKLIITSQGVIVQ